MSIIYMKHPTHGEKVATLEAEAKADEARGWVRFDPFAAKTPSLDPGADHALTALRVAEADVKRRGRPRKAV